MIGVQLHREETRAWWRRRVIWGGVRGEAEGRREGIVGTREVTKPNTPHTLVHTPPRPKPNTTHYSPLSYHKDN